MNVSFRVILAAGAAFALFAGLVSHSFTLATGTALWTLEADPSASFSYVMLMNQVYWGTWALLTPAIFRFADRVPLTGAAWKRRLPIHLVAGSAFVFAHAALVGTGRAWLQAAYGMDTVWAEWIRHQFLRTFDWELTYYAAAVGVRHALVYHRAARDREVRAAELETRLVEAQLQALRMQLNPHFLFNTLHAVSTLVERDPQGVRRMIARLSTLLRYTLERSAVQEVPLHQELAFLRDYLEIQQIRFQGRIEVVESIEYGLHDALVPNLILQPLVENAVKHGVSKTEGTGRIEIAARRAGECLYLSVTDNGPGLTGAPPTDLDGGVGLANTRGRLEGLYGDAQALTFETADGGGLVVHIALPYHTAADLLTTAVVAPA